MEIHTKVLLIAVVFIGSVFLLQRITHMQFWGNWEFWGNLRHHHSWKYLRTAQREMHRDGLYLPATRTVYRCDGCGSRKVEVRFRDGVTHSRVTKKKP
jgi:hypothetical protein